MRHLISLISFILIASCEAPIEPQNQEKDSFSKIRSTHIEIEQGDLASYSTLNNRQAQLEIDFVQDDLPYDLIAGLIPLEELFTKMNQLGLVFPVEVQNKLIERTRVIGELEAQVVCEEIKPDPNIVEQFRCSDDRLAVCHIPTARPNKAMVIRLSEAEYDQVLLDKDGYSENYLLDCKPVEVQMEMKLGVLKCGKACLDEDKILELQQRERELREQILQDMMLIGFDPNQQIDIAELKKQIEENGQDLDKVLKQLEDSMQR
jgi:hypothetical protein